MNKKKFTKHLKTIKELHKAEDKITKAFQLIGSKDFSHFCLEKPITCMTDILQDAMNDKYDYIPYFMYDLEWGKAKGAKKCITERDGTKTSLQTPSQLYDYITKSAK